MPKYNNTNHSLNYARSLTAKLIYERFNIYNNCPENDTPVYAIIDIE